MFVPHTRKHMTTDNNVVTVQANPAEDNSADLTAMLDQLSQDPELLKQLMALAQQTVDAETVETITPTAEVTDEVPTEVTDPATPTDTQPSVETKSMSYAEYQASVRKQPKLQKMAEVGATGLLAAGTATLTVYAVHSALASEILVNSMILGAAGMSAGVATAALALLFVAQLTSLMAKSKSQTSTPDNFAPAMA